MVKKTARKTSVKTPAAVSKKAAAATPKKTPAAPPKKAEYASAIGRRKNAVVKVKLFKDGAGQVRVNEREVNHYFPGPQLLRWATWPLEITGLLKKYDVQASAVGGGVAAQAQAMSLAVSRALLKLDASLRAVLKKEGLLRRDARKKERKKPGLKRARRAPQWQKR